MKPIDRRTLLRTSGATLAAASVLGPRIAAAGDPPRNPWKKAFMLGGATKNTLLAKLQLLKDAGFEGVELISPNEFEQTTS